MATERNESWPELPQLPIVAQPRIPHVLREPMEAYCPKGCGGATLAAGEFWPAFCLCEAMLVAGREPSEWGQFPDAYDVQVERKLP